MSRETIDSSNALGWSPEGQGSVLLAKSDRSSGAGVQGPLFKGRPYSRRRMARHSSSSGRLREVRSTLS
jgi:hypothetical protein